MRHGREEDGNLSVPRIIFIMEERNQRRFWSIKIKCRHNESDIQRYNITISAWMTYYYITTEYLRLSLSRTRKRKKTASSNRLRLRRPMIYVQPYTWRSTYAVIDMPNFDCNCPIIFDKSRERRRTSLCEEGCWNNDKSHNDVLSEITFTRFYPPAMW